MTPRTATILKALAAVGACSAVGYVAYRRIRSAPPAPGGTVPSAEPVPPHARWVSSTDPEYRASASDGYARGASDKALGREFDDTDPYAKSDDIEADYAAVPSATGWRLERAPASGETAHLDARMHRTAWKLGYGQGYQGYALGSTSSQYKVWPTTIPYLKKDGWTAVQPSKPLTAGLRHARHGCAGSPGIELSNFIGRRR